MAPNPLFRSRRAFRVFICSSPNRRYRSASSSFSCIDKICSMTFDGSMLILSNKESSDDDDEMRDLRG